MVRSRTSRRLGDGGYLPPSPLCFWLNLCFVGVAGWVWLQNIDSEELGCKFFGIRTLLRGRKQIPSG
jgi:hypothetical protein